MIEESQLEAMIGTEKARILMNIALANAHRFASQCYSPIRENEMFIKRTDILYQAELKQIMRCYK